MVASAKAAIQNLWGAVVLVAVLAWTVAMGLVIYQGATGDDLLAAYDPCALYGDDPRYGEACED